MAKYYVADTPLIRLDCGTDPSSFPVKRILYWRPDGVSGFWNAVEYGSTQLQYQVPNPTILDIAGSWVFASYVASGLIRYTGESATQQIFKRGR